MELRPLLRCPRTEAGRPKLRRVHVPNGHIAAEDLKVFAALAKRYGQGRLRTTNSQNLVLLDIPESAVEALQQQEIFKAYPTEPGFFTGYASSCTGNAYCNFAPIETKHRLHALTAALDAAFPEVGQPLRVNLTGCFHACAQPQVADIGLTGAARAAARRPYLSTRSWSAAISAKMRPLPRRLQAAWPMRSSMPASRRSSSSTSTCARRASRSTRPSRARAAMHGSRSLTNTQSVDNVTESDYNKNCNCIAGELAADGTAG